MVVVGWMGLRFLDIFGFVDGDGDGARERWGEMGK
jgi:hypothetical protein